jgi:hypothetical protein
MEKKIQEKTDQEWTLINNDDFLKEKRTKGTMVTPEGVCNVPRAHSMEEALNNKLPGHRSGNAALTRHLGLDPIRV